MEKLNWNNSLQRGLSASEPCLAMLKQASRLCRWLSHHVQLLTYPLSVRPSAALSESVSYLKVRIYANSCDMLEMLFRYRHYANRKCPTSFDVPISFSMAWLLFSICLSRPDVAILLEYGDIRVFRYIKVTFKKELLVEYTSKSS